MRYVTTKNVIADKPEWVKCYAWFPVTVETQDNTKVLVWLEWVERKEVAGYGTIDYRYRDIL